MDTSVSPCENFYNYACGKYKTHLQLSATTGHYDHFKEIESVVNQRLQDIISEPISGNDMESLKKAKIAFRACMNPGRNSTGLTEMLSILRQQGGWPMAMTFTRDWNSVSWHEIDKKYVDLVGESAFFRFNVEPDDIYPKRALVLKPGVSTLPTRILQNAWSHSGKIETYRKFIVEVAKRFAEEFNLPERNIMTDVEDMLALETKLAQLQDTAKQSMYRFSKRKSLTMSEFVQRQTKPGSKINWKSTIESFLAKANVKYDPWGKIIVSDTAYFDLLEEILSEESPRVVVNYIHWQFVRRFLGSINSELQFLDLLMRSETLKKKEDISEEMECLEKNPAHFAIVHQYLKKHVPKESEDVVKEMVVDVKKILERQVDGASWLDRKGKQASKIKVERLKGFVGPPSWVRNSVLVNQYYQKLETGHIHLRNVFNAKMQAIRNMLGLLEQPVNQPEDSVIWSRGVKKVNAHYSRSHNYLLISLGVMQPPFFLKDVPENIQFGAYGAVMGHELAHSFDNLAREIAFDGSRMPWSSKSIKAYRERAQCWIDQFNKYQFKDLQTFNRTVYSNGAVTEKENMADTVGMQLTYAAFKAREKDYQKLPGLSTYSDDQLFFLSFANIWCEYRNSENLLFFSKLPSQHSLAEHRVIGTLSNMNGFAEAFECPKNSPMNPLQKCNLWQ
ncbi:membrane metallo-endopeptidase-like 1 isoform X1 [Orussus abietinus]|uniref:membrane metallo-endopeptidase-like 1 isoform X1 n=1 Tax=Orussus abietinus TaxID=222816 RepID=UPI000C715BF4|nr:membrane metallo-endopeptidase-like 1 isoform X1 [Orussus abietinus]